MKRIYQKNRLKKLYLMGTLLLLLTGCGKSPEEKTEIILEEKDQEEPEYALGVADLGDVVSYATLGCVYRQVEDQAVCFQVSGRTINKVNVKVGDNVKKGELLAELEMGDLEQRIARTSYQLQRNRLLLSHSQINLENEINEINERYTYHSEQTDEEYREKEKQIQQLQKQYRYQNEDYADEIALGEAELAILEKEREESGVYSQIDGMVYTMKSELEGSLCLKDEVIMTVIDSSECLFEMENADYASYFQEGQTVSMNIASGAAKGEYILMPYRISQWGEKQLFSIEEQPEEAVLEVGVQGKIQLELGRRENVLRVPEMALHSADGSYYVYTVDANGMRSVSWVEPGLVGNDYVEILSGITQGERVILR